MDLIRFLPKLAFVKLLLFAFLTTLNTLLRYVSYQWNFNCVFTFQRDQSISNKVLIISN